ncbi:iron export ABC transporter permease subunit FetB [Chimaeribacter coloradensis]|uniref:Iron export ABC transporter permease subunit FetB n=1 Tax=Chimaeribacter coloradensis TaxID=2060068 RepID=A0A2N5DU65_9GAMM|nr:iron export ABC transporter permease subunit FetB [Chimaeribacter coloradensis]PLR30320.1 iron export ABC transporter permease subunit FetB [Chimaeribacter coloradensis]
MTHPAITDSSLMLALGLVLVALLVSRREKLGLEKEMIWSISRAVVQLVLVGYVLKSVFALDNLWLTLLMVLFICVNAALNARKRSRNLPHAFAISFAAIAVATGLTLTALLASGAIAFLPMQVIPITGMIAGNAMVAVGLCYTQLRQRFHDQQQQVLEMLSLGATPRQAARGLLRGSIRAALIPTVDAAKTVGLVSLPGMMSGLIFAGVDPVMAIKYQIMVTFMLLATASLSAIIAGYLACRRFFNARQQLVLP